MSFIDQPAARDSSIPYINDNYLTDEQTLSGHSRPRPILASPFGRRL